MRELFTESDWVYFVSGSFLALLVFVLIKTRQYIFQYIFLRKNKPPGFFRSNKIENEDVSVIRHALSLLSSEQKWAKNRGFHCIYGEQYTLYCALALAAKQVLGQYNEQAGYAQEVLIQIHKKFPDRLISGKRSYFNYLLNFNNNTRTTFSDVRNILKSTLAQLQRNIVH